MSLPEFRAQAHEDRAGAICGFLRDPGGTGVGIYVMRAADAAERVAELAERVADLAEQVQEWATDVQADPDRPDEWPRCPQHGWARQLYAEVADGAAVWVCHEGGHQVAPVGSLGR